MANRASMFGERRRLFVAEADEDVTVCEALLAGRDALRELYSGESGPDGQRMEKCAKLLDKKAMRLRAREAASVKLPEYCLCGNNKAADGEFCSRCFSAIPVKLWRAFHTAPLRQMGGAYEAIKDFVRARRPVAVEEECGGRSAQRPRRGAVKKGGRKA